MPGAAGRGDRDGPPRTALPTVAQVTIAAELVGGQVPERGVVAIVEPVELREHEPDRQQRDHPEDGGDRGRPHSANATASSTATESATASIRRRSASRARWRGSARRSSARETSPVWTLAGAAAGTSISSFRLVTDSKVVPDTPERVSPTRQS